MSIPKQEFGVATQLAEVFGYQPVDGILGLGWPALAVDKVSSTPRIYQLELENNTRCSGRPTHAEPAQPVGPAPLHRVDGQEG